MTNRLLEFTPKEWEGDKLPYPLEKGMLYVCWKLKYVAFQCPCGCGYDVALAYQGNEKETYQWRFSEQDGKVTLSPSVAIDPCKAHFFIRNNKIIWV